MGPTEKKMTAGLVVVLVALVAVYFAFPNMLKPPNDLPMGPGMAGRGGGGQAQAPAATGGAQNAAADPAACSTGPATGGAAKTQELGKAGAKLDIIAIIPVAHGCHATSEAALKKAYQAHPNDIHLTIVDLQGPDAAKYQGKVGVKWTVIAINGKSDFTVNGKKVQLQRAENGSYQPSDLAPIIEDQLKGGKAA